MHLCIGEARVIDFRILCFVKDVIQDGQPVEKGKVYARFEKGTCFEHMKFIRSSIFFKLAYYIYLKPTGIIFILQSVRNSF